MKQIISNFHSAVFHYSGKIMLPLVMVLVMSGFHTRAQQLPDVTVRFNNAQYDCLSQIYCLDVEFLSGIDHMQLFGINVRLFYDDNILEYLSIGDTVNGYGLVGDTISTGIDGSGFNFGFGGNSEWLNAKVQMKDLSDVYLSNTQWTKMFNICFHVDDPNSLNIVHFCPSIVWDLNYTENGGYIHGDDGVVITLIDSRDIDSQATNEHVVQYNWTYTPSDDPEDPFGTPVQTNCLSTICWTVPISNWALFLGIGLMIVATLFIYRRRMS